MQLREHQKQLDTFYQKQVSHGFWIDKYKPYFSLYRDRLVKRNAAIAASLPQPLDSVLDLGCGRGDLMALCAPRAGLVVGSDLALTMVRVSLENLADYENVRVVCSPAEELPFADASFNAVILADVVEHLVDVPGCLVECLRILKPAGRVVITTPNARMEHFWQKVDGGLGAPARAVGRLAGRKRKPLPDVKEYFFTQPELAGIARAAGFHIFEHRLIEFYPGSEGGGNFGRMLRLFARQRHLRQLLIEPVFRTVFNGVEKMQVFNNRQLLVLEKK